ncbi:endonuclease/exonuclease/phosphatase family protein [Candidatus Sulfurimonas marisnigri]|uniref:Endonuclease/exonuclease/phosphatase family protein n=1 Tax=Candidatus Sulfurimonas marisnigri TaxID=2740405 RepID=A0A7S7RRG9_9BACT|nr:endonuclease/exonuclease/phosphatase family protein [Candidatus Sulfurimonas marisnigri]QOY55754.1 endonuclease/exonuclease/phosphatase family protein [Candidatus Sulfurimonas marisnigri]
MLKPTKTVKSLKHQDKSLRESFTVLCWNVAKLTLKSEYQDYLNSIVQKYKVDVLLLQEVKKQIANELDISDFSYVLSPNIQTKKHVFGVLSAFKISCENEVSLLTQKRELAYATHKVTLITKHKISHDKEILIVNLHAINFANNSDFYNELESIKLIIKSHTGAMIVAGDFNTWNVKRIQYLKEFTQSLSLKEVKFSDRTNLKKVFTNCLDYIFYRDLELTYSKVIDSKKISDHNPIIATFEF